MADEDKTWFCPRCDRGYVSEEKVKKHVQEQHPDHDPDWTDNP